MRIEFVFPRFKLLSGAERLILSLGRALVHRGERVRVVCHRFDPSCADLASGLEVVSTGAALELTGNHYLDSVLGYVRAGGLRRHLDPAADVTCLFGPALVLAARRQALPGRVLYFCYEPPRAADVDRKDVLARVGPWRWALAPALALWRSVDRWLVGRVDGLLVNGEFGRERAKRTYGRDARVVTHGVDLARPEGGREEARAALGLDAREPVVLSVNFLHPRKRVDLVLRSWQEVERRVRGARLLLVGEGPEAERLRQLASELGLRRVVFAGFVPERRLGHYYQAADLLVHAARQETLGLTVLEAASFGVPAVTVDEGGPRYTVLDGETGLRVTPEPEALGAAIAELLADLPRLRAMGERARRFVASRFSWERGAEDFLAACREEPR
jgi:glycosyltransferase involved in cell wall biosynthesis